MRRRGNLGFDYAAENENLDIVKYLLTDKTLIAYNRHIIFPLHDAELDCSPYTVERRSLQKYIMTGKLNTAQTILNIVPQNEVENMKYKILEALAYWVSKKSLVSTEIFKFSSYLVEKFNLTSEDIYGKIDSDIDLHFLEPLIVAYQERVFSEKFIELT